MTERIAEIEAAKRSTEEQLAELTRKVENVHRTVSDISRCSRYSTLLVREESSR